MINLLIDTSTSNLTVSIIEEQNILYKYQQTILSDMASKLLPIIDNGLKQLNLTLKDIDKIFVVNGPGSFTGIRVGVTVAKTIAWTLKKDIIPLSSLELMATTHTNKKYLVPMIDARRGNVFTGIYDKNLNCIKEDKLVNLEKSIKNLNDDYEFISYDNINLDNLIKPNIDILKIINKHTNDKGINPHNLNPNYLKLTEAEENKLKND
ncbi:MAG: tRNA (adenosine(37)-N6)-threonylcarbamoyltransferase complex dimerization subunit type 1 TsaB [Firmicutes bacterium]|nr:tRNA (adenosine(37)-N6)-threonylcarbamoyltransferase complex dimerization subunit type 1 TsaB [Bacillota bacterium]